MEEIIINNDIQVIYVTATSFPEGIKEAFNRLQGLLPATPPRRLFGLSRPENGGGIIYRAAGEILQNEDTGEWKGKTLTIKSGKYKSIIVEKFMKNPQAIGQAFEKLLQLPNLDPNGYCVEVYDPEVDLYGTDKESVTCMIRLQE